MFGRSSAAGLSAFKVLCPRNDLTVCGARWRAMSRMVCFRLAAAQRCLFSSTAVLLDPGSTYEGPGFGHIYIYILRVVPVCEYCRQTIVQ